MAERIPKSVTASVDSSIQNVVKVLGFARGQKIGEVAGELLVTAITADAERLRMELALSEHGDLPQFREAIDALTALMPPDPSTET